MHCRLIVLTVLCALAISTTAIAEDNDHHGNHHLAVFMGAASTSHDTSASVGADYEYRLPTWSHRLGVALIGDSTFTDHTVLIAAGLAVVHPLKGFKLFAGPGVETADGHSVFLSRGGVGYDVHLGAYSISPEMSIDYAGGHAAIVYGIAAGLSL